MSEQRPHGISSHGLDDAFQAEETRKSNLLLEAQLLRAQRQDEAAAAKFAEAAEIEEGLSDQCAAKGLLEKSWLHRFSAASAWAQAGNFYQALSLCQELLARNDLPEPLRRTLQEYADKLRARRAQWYASLELELATKAPR
jgi:hypothetical protein